MTWWYKVNNKGMNAGGSHLKKNTLHNGTIVNTLTILATVGNNNTQLRCHATGNPGPNISEPVYLTVADTKEQLELKYNP